MITNKEELMARVMAKANTTIANAKTEILNNEKLMNLRVASYINDRAIAKLDSINSQCNELVSSMPVFNVKTKQDRQWRPSTQYGLGMQVEKLIGIINGVHYSCATHKPYLLEILGISPIMLEETLSALGSLPYYNKNYGIVVDGTPADVDTLLGNLTLIAEALDIQLDTKYINQANMDNRYTVAKANADKTAALASTTNTLDADTFTC